VKRDPNYLGSTMVRAGDADAFLTGLMHHYPSALRPPLQVVGTAPDADYVAGVYMLTFKNRVVFCADTTVNQDPDEEVLAEVAQHTADLARRFNVDPRVAMLSYSNFGSVDNEGTRKPRHAARMLREDPDVDFPVDGEMQADTAVVEDILGAPTSSRNSTTPRTCSSSRIWSRATSATSCSSASAALTPSARCWSAWTSPSTSSSGATR